MVCVDLTRAKASSGDTYTGDVLPTPAGTVPQRVERCCIDREQARVAAARNERRPAAGAYTATGYRARGADGSSVMGTDFEVGWLLPSATLWTGTSTFASGK